MAGFKNATRMPRIPARLRRTFDTLANDADATTTDLGMVKKQANLADATALTDSSGGSSGSGTIASVGVTVTAPANTPASADALRDDLEANALADIRTSLAALRNAVSTLAEHNNDLQTKLNAMLSAQQTAGQMAAS